MSLNEIAYSIAEDLNRPQDLVLIKRLKFAINYWRAFLIRQDVERNNQSGEYIQTITVPVQLVDKGDNCYVEVGCKILKTSSKIPTPVNLKAEGVFNYVGAVNMKKPFGYRSHNTAALSFTGKNKAIYYSMNNGYIYIWGNNLIDYITISGIFFNPLDAYSMCVNKQGCNVDDEPYPCGSHLIKTITEGIVQGKLSIDINQDEILNRDEIDRGNR